MADELTPHDCRERLVAKVDDIMEALEGNVPVGDVASRLRGCLDTATRWAALEIFTPVDSDRKYAKWRGIDAYVRSKHGWDVATALLRVGKKQRKALLVSWITDDAVLRRYVQEVITDSMISSKIKNRRRDVGVVA